MTDSAPYRDRRSHDVDTLVKTRLKLGIDTYGESVPRWWCAERNDKGRTVQTLTSTAKTVYVVVRGGQYHLIAHYPQLSDRPWVKYPFMVVDLDEARDIVRRRWPYVRQEWTTEFPWASRPAYL